MRPEKRRIKFAVMEQPREPITASPEPQPEDLATLGDLALRSFEPDELLGEDRPV